ncbi:prenyltransferase/squalene oxidase repeat-containing protein [Sporosarcina obsidiansis]|uniref:prenyltransferase/squalene oxidase repeat-containing protein n=1 Tax=Sporosarcina obsidiansis TaxID=2660748 RepID=UPI00129B9E0F|nr:prenyltransferase/squalene oxidase repeat-containing protein [Sporosarcina obsidiansis]
MYKRYLSVFASILLALTLLSPTVNVAASEPQETVSVMKATQDDVQQALQKVTAYILQQGVSSEWEAIGLAKAGVTVPASYEEVFYQNVQDQVIGQSGGSRLKITDVERLAIASVAIGKDPTNIKEFNLLDKIYNSEDIRDIDTMTRQGTNGLIFALIALDTKNYSVPTNARWDREKIIAELLSYQRDDGAWSLSTSNTGSSSYDMTAMSLIALAPYTDQSNVRNAVDRAVNFLSEHQGPTGGFEEAFVGGISSEATAQVIIGLTANKIDPQGERFTKNGISLLDHLLGFQAVDGGFKHTAGDSASNNMATEQALQALVAFDLYTKGQGSLYDFSQAETQPQPEISGHSSLKGVLNDSLLSVQKNKYGAWSQTFIEKTETKDGYFIVQVGEQGNQQTASIPQGTKRVFLVDNDRSYHYFPAQVVEPNKKWNITFNKTLQNTPSNLNKIYVEDAQGQRVPVSITVNGAVATVTPQTNYTSRELYSLFIVESVSEDGTTLKQATRKLFIIQ